MAKSYIISLDIGSFMIKGALFEEENGEYIYLSKAKTETEGIIQGEIQDVELVRSTINKLLNELKNSGSKKIKNYDLIVGYSTNSLNISQDSLTVEPPEKKEIKVLDLKKIKNSIIKKYEDEGKEVLDSNFMKFIVDDKTVRNPISFYSQKSLSASLNVVWVDENAFALLANVLKRLDADSITLYDSTLCTSYSITTATDRDIGLTVVDFGYHMCRIMIFKNGIPRMYYAFPYGIRYVLKDIQNVIKTTEKEAHRLLSEEAVCLRDTNAKPKRVDFIPISGNGKSVISQNLLNKIVFARLREIISRMNGELSKKSYENTLEMGALQGGIIYTGGGSYIKNIESTIKDLMGKNFRKGTWVNKSFFKIPEELKDDAEFIPVFSVLNKHLTEINENENEKIDFEEDNSPEPSSKNPGEKKSILKNWFKKLSGGDE